MVASLITVVKLKTKQRDYLFHIQKLGGRVGSTIDMKRSISLSNQGP